MQQQNEIVCTPSFDQTRFYVTGVAQSDKNIDRLINHICLDSKHLLTWSASFVLQKKITYKLVKIRS
jgi:hypothetical protein